MSHPVPGHHYGEDSHESHSPHKDISGKPKYHLNRTQRSMKKMLHEAGKDVRGKNESHLDYLKRQTTHALSKALERKKKHPGKDFTGSSTNDR